MLVADRFPDDLERFDVPGPLCGGQLRRFGGFLRTGLLRAGASLQEQSERDYEAGGSGCGSARIRPGSSEHGRIAAPVGSVSWLESRLPAALSIKGAHRSISLSSLAQWVVRVCGGSYSNRG